MHTQVCARARVCVFCADACSPLRCAIKGSARGTTVECAAVHPPLPHDCICGAQFSACASYFFALGPFSEVTTTTEAQVRSVCPSASATERYAMAGLSERGLARVLQIIFLDFRLALTCPAFNHAKIKVLFHRCAVFQTYYYYYYYAAVDSLKYTDISSPL
jgi:hypothetical protein